MHYHFDLHLGIFLLAIALSSTLTEILALPVLPLSSNLTSSLQATRPPENPVCPITEEWGSTLGHPSYKDCDYILSNLYPKDPQAKPVLRKFYTAPADVSHTMPNVRLPYEQSYSIDTPPYPKKGEVCTDVDFVPETCNVQLLLATDFNDVPHDEATWNDIRGAARIVFRGCLLGKGLGGLITKNGNNRNIEIIVYGKKSIYAKNQILKYSPDPLARSIAAQELLELVGAAPVPVPAPPELAVGTIANATAAE